MSDEKKEKEPPIDAAGLFGDDLICADVEARDREYYEWDAKELRWKLIPCIDNKIVRLFLQVRGSAPSTKEAANVRLALGATQSISGLKSPCLIDFKTRTAQSLDGAVFAANGVVTEARDGTLNLHPYSQRIFSLYRLPYAYDPAATCPQIDEWLADRLGGDQEQITAFWELAGACLKPGNQWKSFWVFAGEGSTGKTSGLNLLRDVLGEENCSDLPASYLNVPSVTPQARGKLVNISEEKTGISQSCEETIKGWSSGGPVFFNPKFRSAYSEPASAKLLFSMNRLPQFSDSSHAVYNRAVILTWTKPIALDVAMSVEQVRKNLRHELPGALNRALRAKQELEKRGRVLRPSGSVELAKELQRESSPIVTWFYERATYRPNAKTLVESAYDDFTNWCLANGVRPPPSRMNFGRGLRDIGSLDDGTVVKIRAKRTRNGKTPDGKEAFANAYEGLALLFPEPKGLVLGGS